MAKFNFGIDPDKLKEDQFLQLISWGSIPAEYMYRDAIKNNQIKLRKLSKHIKTAEESGIIFSNHLKSLPRQKILASLISIKKEVQEMPVRALINPHIGANLAKKISKIKHEIRLKDVEKFIKNGTFKFNENGSRIKTQDLNKIRYSVVWLNQYNELPKTLDIKDMCLSPDAYSIFIKEGFSGLYKIAKGNKRYLKKIFNKCDEIQNYKFFKYASLSFDYIWNSKCTKTDREKFPGALDSLYFNDDRGNQNYPVFYIFNSAMDLNRIKYFTDAGYFRLGQIQLIDPSNQELYSDKDIFKILYESFSKYKI